MPNTAFPRRPTNTSMWPAPRTGTRGAVARTAQTPLAEPEPTEPEPTPEGGGDEGGSGVGVGIEIEVEIGTP